MGKPGIGVMLGHLSGNEKTVASYHASVGKKIVDLRIEDDKLVIDLEGGTRLFAFDDGQSCCENRYPTTDDDLSYHVGATLQNIEVKEGGETEEEYEVHEFEFLEVTTSKGHFQIVNHNEHNGYYGGFNVVLRTESE